MISSTEDVSLSEPRDDRIQIPPWAVLVAGFMLLMGVGLQFAAQAQNTAYFQLINHESSRVDPMVWSFLTWLGDTSLLWPMLLPLMKSHPKAVICAVASVPVGGCLSWLLKWSFNSPRPAGVLDLGDLTIIGPTLTEHSFPSGHTITAFAACVALILGIKWGKTILGKGCPYALVLLASLIGLSRIMVGAHWPWDVLAGAGVGCLSAMCGAYAVNRYPKLQHQVNLQRSIVLIFWVMAMAHWLSPLKDPAQLWVLVLSSALASWGTIQFLRSSARLED